MDNPRKMRPEPAVPYSLITRAQQGPRREPVTGVAPAAATIEPTAGGSSEARTQRALPWIHSTHDPLAGRDVSPARPCRPLVNCDGLHTVAQTTLTTRIGAVDDATLERVCSAVSYALDC